LILQKPFFKGERNLKGRETIDETKIFI